MGEVVFSSFLALWFKICCPVPNGQPYYIHTCIYVAYIYIHIIPIQVIFRNIDVYSYTYMHAIILVIKEAISLKESSKGFGGGKGREKC